MKLVVMESPYKGDVERNVKYARQCMLDCLGRGESVIAGHLLYTQVWDDANPAQRAAGIKAHLAWVRRADMVVVYEDYGISEGMQLAIDLAKASGVPIEYRGIAEV